MQKVLFLDRDGVINVDHGYLYKPSEVEFVGGVFALCQRFQDAGYKIVVITNQSGIGRGYYTEQDFLHLSAWMAEQFAAQGITIDGFYFCPHHSTGAKGEYLKDCDCRKPKPGMLLQAAKELDVDLTQSVIVGDKISDIQAGQGAGLQRCILLCNAQDSGSSKETNSPSGYEQVTKLTEIRP